MTDQFKQALVLRTDLDLSAGKAAAQAAHVSVFASQEADEVVTEEWLNTSCVKVVLAADSEEELRELYDTAHQNEIPASIVADEGRTEIDSGTVTALAVGPAATERVDDVTGHLSLY